jgi:very-short-patch-repair endonuclease
VAFDLDDVLRPQAQTPIDRRIAELAAGQHGIVTLDQLVGVGLGVRAVAHRVATGRLHRLHRSVFAVGHTALTVDGRRLAAVWACGPGAALSHRSAGALWGLCRDGSARFEVLVQAFRRQPSALIRLRMTRRLEPDEVDELRAIPVTTVARTLVDLAAVLPANRLERALHEAEVLGLLDVMAVLAVAERRPGLRGVKRLRRLLHVPSAGMTRSELEERFLRLCRHAVARPQLNAHVDVGDRLIEVDALWPGPRVVVELDGAAAHHTRRAFEADRRRDAALAAVGYLVLRFTWARVVHEAPAVIGELRAVLEHRGV